LSKSFFDFHLSRSAAAAYKFSGEKKWTKMVGEFSSYTPQNGQKWTKSQ
jgi:hypothetical protein